MNNSNNNNGDPALTDKLELLKKIGIGYDGAVDSLSKIDEQKVANYPPYNIIRVSDDEYLIEVLAFGISSSDVSVSQLGSNLTVKAGRKTSDKLFTFKGIKDDAVDAMFLIAPAFTYVDYKVEDSIINLSVRSKAIIAKEAAEAAEKKRREAEAEIFRKEEEANFKADQAEKEERKREDRERKEERHEDKRSEGEHSEVVEAKEKDHGKPKAKAEESVGTLVSMVGKKIVDSAVEVMEDEVLAVVKTAEGKTDVIVAAAEVSIDEVKAAVIAEIEAAPEKVAEHVAPVVTEIKNVLIDKTDKVLPTVEVSIPDVIEQVIKVEKAESKLGEVAIVITSTAENVSETAILKPIITSDDQPDVVLAVEPELEKELAEAGVVVEDVVEKAVIQTAAKVETSVEVTPEAIQDAMTPEVADKIAQTEVSNVTIIVDKPTPDSDPVEVTLTTNMQPSVIEVKMDDKPSDSSMPAITVSDATIEIKDPESKIEILKTAEGKSDIAVAIAPSVKEAIPEVMEAVKKALESTNSIPDAVDAAPESDITVEVETERDEPNVNVVIPETIEQIVTVTKEANGQLTVANASADVPVTDSVATPIVTANDVDIVAMIPADVDPAVVEAAVKEALPEVVTTEPVDEIALENAIKIEELKVEKAEEVANQVAEVEKNKGTVAEVKAPATKIESQIVEVTVDPRASNTKKTVLEVKDATIEVSDNVEIMTLKTEDGKTDVAVAIAPELKVALEAKEIDILAAIADKVVAPEASTVTDTTPEPTPEAEPNPETVVVVNKDNQLAPTMEVTVPDVIPSVMKVVEVETVAANTAGTEVAIKLEPVVDIAEDANLTPIETPAGSVDVLVDIPELEKATKIQLVKAIEEAIAESKPEVKPAVEVSQPAVDAASLELAALTKQEAITEAPTSIVVKTDVVVEKAIEAETTPQVVEVKIDANDNIKLVDATIEVSDEAKTAVAIMPTETTAAVIVASTPEVDAKLEAANTTAVEVAAAVADVPVKVEVVAEKTEEVLVQDADLGEIKVLVPNPTPQVVEVVVEEDEVKLVPAEVKADSNTVAVVSPTGEPDMIVINETPIKAEAIEEAVQAAESEVVAAAPAPAEKIELAEKKAIVLLK